MLPAGIPPPPSPPPPPPARTGPGIKTPRAKPGRPDALPLSPLASPGGPQGRPPVGMDFQSELALRLARQTTPSVPPLGDPSAHDQSSSDQANSTAKDIPPDPIPPTLPTAQQLSDSSGTPAAPPTPPLFPISPQLQDKPFEQSLLSQPQTSPHPEGGSAALHRGSGDRRHSISPSLSIMLQRRQSMRRASMRRDKLQHSVLTANPMLEAPEKPPLPIALHPHNPDTHVGYADAPWALRLRKEYFSPVEKLSCGRDLALVYHQVGGVGWAWAR